MNCRDARKAIHLNLDGELGTAEARLREHLAVCASCGTVAAELSSVRHRLRQMDRLGPLAWEEKRPAPPTPWRGQSRWIIAAPFSLATAAVLAAFAVFEPVMPEPADDVSARKPDSVAVRPIAFALHEPTADEYLAVRLPSRQPDVHIIWLYPQVRAEPTMPNTNGKISAGDSGSSLSGQENETFERQGDLP